MTNSSLEAASACAYRDQVSSTVRVAALLVRPGRSVGSVLRAIRGTLYTQRGVKNVMDLRVDALSVSPGGAATPAGVAGGVWKKVLIDPSVWSAESASLAMGAGSGSSPMCRLTSAESVASLKLPDALLSRLLPLAAPALPDVDEPRPGTQGGRPEPHEAIEMGVTLHSVELTYLNYTMPELLRMVLPISSEERNLVALSGFEQVGHIAHVNLSSAHLPYRHTIGQVIIDCNPTVLVVVNKVDSISSVFREFQMDIIGQAPATAELIAAAAAPSPADRSATSESAAGASSPEGEGREAALNALLTATVRQHGCTFKVPYNRVYWNSRLSFEHTRLVEKLKPGDMLFDVMAGVGPFAVPAAKSGVTVFANDLNPVASEYMRINARLNQVEPNDMFIFNLDGREFMNRVLYKSVMGIYPGEPSDTCRGRRHVTMNLPAIAVEFLDVFSPSAQQSPWRRRAASSTFTDKRVLIHVYCFSAAEDVLVDAVRQVELHLGYELPAVNREDVVMVRDVAPTKRMVRVSFTLPDAFWSSMEHDADEEGARKVARLEN